MTLAALVCTASCGEIDSRSDEVGTISFTVETEQSTRAASSTTVVDQEAAVNSVAIYIFNSAGNLEACTTGTSLTATLTCTAGSGYTAEAVINAPAAVSQALASVTTRSALQSAVASLTASNATSTGFLMTGSSSSFNVTANSTTTVPISVSRLVSRISLKSITNALPSSLGSVTINNVFLSNVISSIRLDGTKVADTYSAWLNPMGRRNESPLVSSHVVDGITYTSTAADLTFRSISRSLASSASYTTVQRMYCYPNPTATDTQGFSTTFSIRYTRLVITATIDGTKYYYPIDIPQPQRNTCYDVDVTLRNLGSDDPDVPVALGDLDVTITVNGWEAGSAITENL